MRRLKQISLLLIIILIMIGVCGCINVEQDYKAPIRNYLEAKYGCDFVIHKAEEAFSGNDGFYIYAVCESEDYEGEPFDVYCYPDDGEKTGEHIFFDGETYIIYEKYAEVYFANQMKQDIKHQLTDDVFVACKIQFDCGHTLHYSITEEQFKMGLDSCLNNKEFYSYVTIYIVANGNADIGKIQDTVETYCLNYNAHEQLLFFAISPMMDKNVIEHHYEENLRSFGNHMLECKLIEEIVCTEMNRDKGIIERTIEKN